MKTIRTIIYLAIVIVLWGTNQSAWSQTQSERAEIVSKYDKPHLKSLQAKFAKQYKSNAERALREARSKSWPDVKRFAGGNRVGFLQGIDDAGEPVYLSPMNVDAARSTRAKFLNPGEDFGFYLDGTNMTAYVWDVVQTRPTHQEFQSVFGSPRVTVMDGAGITEVSDPPPPAFSHATNVTGTLLAAGIDSNAKGMAPWGKARTYQSSNDLSEATAAALEGMLLSNHSYGRNIENITNDWQIGAYTTLARDWDELMHEAPYYLMVIAAGNDGEDDSSNSQPMGGNASYDKLTHFNTAKNNLSVASVDDAQIGYGGSFIAANISYFSSEGPTDDLRIKPDLAGNGDSVYTPGALDDADYDVVSGTSFAAPNVTGSLLLLQQYHRNILQRFMKAATLKGLALHTADDIGPVGPDAQSGWGLLNAKKAVETIASRNKDTSLMEERRICSSNGPYTFSVTANGREPLQASISWTDPPGQPVNGVVNSTTPVLVDDLDIRISQGSTTYYPYKLTSADQTTTGDNKVDPFEKVSVDNASGDYTITVRRKGVVGCRDYSMVVSGIRGEFAAPDDLKIIHPYHYNLTWTDLSEPHVAGTIEVERSYTPTSTSFFKIDTIADIHATSYYLGSASPIFNYRLKFVGPRGLVKYSNITFDAQFNGTTNLETFKPYYFGLRWDDPNADYHTGTIEVQRSYTPTSDSFWTMQTLTDVHETYYYLGSDFPIFKYRLKYTDSIGRTAYSNISDEGILKPVTDLETFKPYYYNLRWTDPNSSLLTGTIDIQRTYTPTGTSFFTLDTITNFHATSYYLGQSFPQFKYRLRFTDQIGRVAYSNVSDEGLLKPITDLEIFKPYHYGLRWSDPNASFISGSLEVQRTYTPTGTSFFTVHTVDDIHETYYYLGPSIPEFKYRIKITDSLGRTQYSNVVQY